MQHLSFPLTEWQHTHSSYTQHGQPANSPVTPYHVLLTFPVGWDVVTCWPIPNSLFLTFSTVPGSFSHSHGLLAWCRGRPALPERLAARQWLGDALITIPTGSIWFDQKLPPLFANYCLYLIKSTKFGWTQSCYLYLPIMSLCLITSAKFGWRVRDCKYH